MAALSQSSGISCERINADAVDIAAEAAADAADVWVCGGISNTTSFERGAGEETVKEELRPMADIFVQRKTDFLLAGTEDRRVYVEDQFGLQFKTVLFNLDFDRNAAIAAIELFFRLNMNG